MKLADLCGNIAALPDVWPYERKVDYLKWAETVAQRCFGVSSALDVEFQNRMTRARIDLNKKMDARHDDQEP